VLPQKFAEKQCGNNEIDAEDQKVRNGSIHFVGQKTVEKNHGVGKEELLEYKIAPGYELSIFCCLDA
jgi:hypothetical protein